MSVIRPRTWKAGFISGSAKARHYIRCFQVCREMIDETNQVISGRLEKHDLVDQISRYISANYQSNITLQDIMDQIHISSAYVSRLFRK